MYKTILVPVDLAHADHAREVLATARKIGGADARIVTLYVAAELPGAVLAAVPEDFQQTIVGRAEDQLNAVADSAAADAMVRTGQTATTILEVAAEMHADLIVIASHRPGLQDYFLGSTAARVVRHAPCAVLVDR